jgi:uncharacterized SAM-binding protein YcdF (DUF218 family)
MSTWTWSWAIRNLLAELLMPPGIWVVIGLVALILFRNRRQLQTTSIALCFVMVWLTSTTFFANTLVRMTDPWMHWPAPVDIRTLPKTTTANLNNQKVQNISTPQAIVILGGGRRKNALDNPEYQLQDVSKESMERLRMGARLVKQTHLPVLVTGGSPDATYQNEQSEAKLMADVLEKEFNVKPTWIENKSATTQENAKLSSEMLNANKNNQANSPIKNVYLVTHFWHMPRAKAIFEKEGFSVTSISLGFDIGNKKTAAYLEGLSPVNFAPSSNAISKTRQIWHELMGNFYYKIRY